MRKIVLMIVLLVGCDGSLRDDPVSRARREAARICGEAGVNKIRVASNWVFVVECKDGLSYTQY